MPDSFVDAYLNKDLDGVVTGIAIGKEMIGLMMQCTLSLKETQIKSHKNIYKI